MARDLQGFLGLTLSSVGQHCYSEHKGWHVWVFRIACVFACVLGPNSGDM